MFISVLELFKVGVGPSSSHTLGPMVAARRFVEECSSELVIPAGAALRCTLKGSLAFTGKGHSTDRAVLLGVHGYRPERLIDEDIDLLVEQLSHCTEIQHGEETMLFDAEESIIFDRGEPLAEHPNGMLFELLDSSGEQLHHACYFSIGGGFIATREEINQIDAPLKTSPMVEYPYPFDSAAVMLQMAEESGQGIAEMKRANELAYSTEEQLNRGLDTIWHHMEHCVARGLEADGILPGGLDLHRRAAALYCQLQQDDPFNLNELLCAYAMAVNEENAAGHMVVTAPTNGAAGVIPAVLYEWMHHHQGTQEQVRTFLLTAAAIGGLIKHRSSISGAEVGCQGEVGSASAMAAAGLCAVRGGTPQQVENAAEIALEHHLGMTCDPVNGLVQVPCIERNGFGAIKAHAAAALAIHGSGQHFMPLDGCIAAMKQTGLEMSHKFKETSQGGLAVSLTEC